MKKIIKLNDAISLLEDDFPDHANGLRETKHEMLMSGSPNLEILRVNTRGYGIGTLLERLHKKTKQSLVRNLKTNEQYWISKGRIVRTKLKIGKGVKIGDQEYILRNVAYCDDRLFFYVEGINSNYDLKEIVGYNYKHYDGKSECIWENK